MASIAGTGQQPLEFNFAECPDPKKTAEAFLKIDPPPSLFRPSIETIYRLKSQFLQTHDLTVLAEIVYRLGHEFRGGSNWGEVYLSLWPCFPCHAQGSKNFTVFWDSIPLGTRVELAHIDGTSIQGIKQDSSSIITDEGGQESLYKQWDIACHIRILPKGLENEVMPLLESHLIPDVAKIAFSYLRGPSLYEEDIAKLRKDLEGFVPPQ